MLSSRVLLHCSEPHLASAAWARALGPPTRMLRCDAGTLVTTLIERDGPARAWSDPLEALAWMGAHGRGAGGRWVGYLSYDLGRLFERVPAIAADDLSVPLFVFTYHQCSGEAGGDAGVATTGKPGAMHPGRASLPASRGSAGASHSHDRATDASQLQGIRSTFTREEYLAAVRRTIDYIAAGDIFQVNLSQRFTAELPAPPEQIWRRLAERTPAHYGALLDYGDFALLSNSPELFLRVTPLPAGRRKVITRPIKGTRPLGPGMESELRDSIKDQAELNMIVDLERNDLGRVCEIGSVKVIEPRIIEAHPTVYHGVATVEGVLRGDVGFVDLLRATFPGGSITGAPKIRAMEIIEELEPVRRGPYCGAIGYIDDDGSMEFNIAIRTMIVAGGQVHIPVGGGIVADSVPEDEYEETLVKARAMFGALGIEEL